MTKIDSLLSARQFVVPQLAGGRLYFVSNMSGRLSLYAMDARPGGSMPEPLLPPDIALQNPHLIEGYLYRVFPKLGKILLMLDKDGDEKYKPMLIPLTGGYPEPIFADELTNYRLSFLDKDLDRGIAYFHGESLSQPLMSAWKADLNAMTIEKMAESKWGSNIIGTSADHKQAILVDAYTPGDHAVFHWTRRSRKPKLIYGVPMEDRAEGQEVPPNSINNVFFTKGNKGILFVNSIFSDSYGLGYMSLKTPGDVKEVKIVGQVHIGAGELTGCNHTEKNKFLVTYNIDGVSWAYEAEFNEAALEMQLGAVLCGLGELANGVLDTIDYDKSSKSFAISLSTATSPTQIYSVSGKDRTKVVRHTTERVLGLSDDLLSSGEDASFTSHDGLRISARLYLPAASLGFTGPRPIAYYIHGGPQGQERPDFAWFSMPLIQYLTLNGFAVFVPNVRGSTGYGFSYMKHVDRDWGGQDRLDHVHAMTQVLPNDSRLDVKRTAVLGRSYGGYMTLTLATRHPELWAAAVDMFGPYDLFTFMDRIPETWKSYFHVAVGHPDKDRDFLNERSPRTYIDQLACPMLVIQGKNDPRVIEQESRDVVEKLKAQGKEVDYLMFENEGHDVIKFENKVRCYNAITDFFKKYLRP
jgi:pimeloyl-ACP methyl ester carboxylesterase